MWTREQLKDKAKAALKRNYWVMVLVGVIFSFIGGTSGGGASFNFNYNVELPSGGTGGEFSDNPIIHSFQEMVSSGVFATIFAVIMVIAMAGTLVGLALHFFLFNPLDVGTKRFFFKNLNENADIREILHSFQGNYWNVVKVMFFRDLYVTLWTFLFIIPGIIKGYEYRMIPYLLAENPNMDKEQAFDITKRMMNGQKWDTFVLELSFLGWDILATFTLGLLNIFYVNPYRQQTFAALYESLCYRGATLGRDEI